MNPADPSRSSDLQRPGASLAVIIVNWNSGPHLAAAVRGVLEQTVQPGRIVVVDNDSSDDSLDGISALSDRVEIHRRGRNTGFAAGNNFAVGTLSEDIRWLALLNPDAIPEPGWLEALLGRAASHPEYSFFASRALQARTPERVDGTGDVYHFSGLAWRRGFGLPASNRYLEDDEVFAPCAAAALYRRSAWESVGGMDERFFCYFEDVDLGFRLRLQGHRCRYVAEAVVHHIGSESSGSHSPFTIYHGHRNMVWCWFKNQPLVLLVLFFFPHMLINLVAIVHHGLKGRGRAVLRAKLDGLKGLPALLAERRRIQAGRTAGLWELVRSFSFRAGRR